MAKNEIPAIELRDLCRAFKGVPAVSHLSFLVPAKGCFALLGVNGAGKTTTIRMLSGLTRPDSGDALLLGQSVVTQPQQVKRMIGVSMQETAVAPNLTVKENLELMAALTCSQKEHCAQRVQDSLDSLDLRQVAGRRAKTLSGGWQRRLSIAMAMINQPRILFLDEPTLGLDIIARRELWQVISTLKEQVAVILTTHYLEEAEALADQIGIMAHGQLRAIGSAGELCRASGHDKFEDAFLAFAGEIQQ